MRIQITCGIVALALVAGCGPRDPAPPSPDSLQRLRAQFLYDDVAVWMREGRTRPSVRAAAEAAGFALDGSGRQGDQEVDGFTRTPDAPGPLTALTAVYDAGSTRLNTLTVTALAPELREHARALTTAAASTVEGRTARSGSAAILYFLGAERLGPERLLRTSVRLDRAADTVYSVVYVVSPE